MRLAGLVAGMRKNDYRNRTNVIKLEIEGMFRVQRHRWGDNVLICFKSE